MTPTVSTYLDIVRICAALAVVLYHASRALCGGNWLRPTFGAAGTDAVVVFFVLSGLVIAHVAQTREQTVKDFVLARLARLWSVAIPALILTAAADTIGRAVAPEIYANHYPLAHPIENIVASALFVNQLWFLNLRPLTNAPFWSLSYEFWYYMWFCAVVIVGGRRGMLLGVLVLAVMGFKILLLFPAWWLGLWAWRKMHRLQMSERPLPAVVGWMLIVLAPVGCVALHQLYLVAWCTYVVNDITGGALGFSDSFVTGDILAVLVALHFVGVFSIERHIARPIAFVAPVARTVAGYTFSIYLYHFPLLYLFTAILRPKNGNDTAVNIVIIMCTLVVCVAVGRFTERRKANVRAFLEAVCAPFIPKQQRQHKSTNVFGAR